MTNYTIAEILSTIDSLYEEKGSFQESYLYNVSDKIQQATSQMDNNSLVELFAPYINKYVYVDERMMKHSGFYYTVIKGMIASCPQILNHVNIDLYIITQQWGDYFFRQSSDDIFLYIRLLDMLFNAKYKTDWRDLMAKVRKELQLAEQYTNYRRGEVFAFLAGFIQIVQTDKSDSEKGVLINLMISKWRLVCPIFAVLIRRVIGTKVPNFAALTNNVLIGKANHANINLFYNALVEKRNELCKIDTDRKIGKGVVIGSESYNFYYTETCRKIDGKIKAMEDILQSTTQEHDLDELVSLIFPNLKICLNSERVVTYNQLKAKSQEQKLQIEHLHETINDWMKKTEQLESRVKELEPFQDLAISMRNSYLENAIPIETLANSIKAIRDSNVQFQVFAMLNQLLRKDTAWRNHRDELEEEIGKRFFGDENAATHEQTEMLRANLEQQTNILQEVANKKTIGTLVMEQHNHGGGLSLPNTQEQGLLE